MEENSYEVYLRNFDKELASEMFKQVNSNPDGVDILKVRAYLEGKKAFSKTAYYYLGIFSDGYLKGTNKDEAKKYFLEGRGDLFCDYMLFRETYINEKIKLSISRVAITVDPIYEALRELSEDKNDVEASLLLYDFLTLGIEAYEDEKLSNELLTKCVNASHREALYIQALNILRSRDSEKDNPLAIDYLERSSKLGYYPASNTLLSIYKQHPEMKVTQETMFALEDELAENSPKYAFEYAQSYYSGETKNYSRALKLFKMAEKGGVAVDHKYYSTIYYMSYVGLKNANRPYEKVLAEAIRLLKEDLNSNDMESYLRLSDIYQYEESEKDINKARGILENVFKVKPSVEIAHRLYDIYLKDMDSDTKEKALDFYTDYIFENEYLKEENPDIDAQMFRRYFERKKKQVTDKPALLNLLSLIEEKDPSYYHIEASLLYTDLGKAKKAKEELDKATKDDFISEKDYLRFAELYYKNGDFLNANTYYFKAYNNGNVKAAFHLALDYMQGHDVEKDYDKALEYLDFSAKHGYHQAFYLMAQIYLSRGDNLKGIEALQTGASYDEATCELILGNLYYEGKTVSRDLEKAASYYHDAAIQKNPEALYKLGFMLYNGIGFEQNKEKALVLYDQSYRLGYEKPLFELGKIYTLEFKNPKGLEYLNKSFDEGDIQAASILGSLYFEGELVKKNYQKAFSYYTIAKDTNDSLVFYRLGYMKEKGLGTIANGKKALEYYEQASLLGNDEAHYQAGLLSYNLKDYEKAKDYLSSSLNDDRPYGYYAMAIMNLTGKLTNSNAVDGKYYAEKAYSLGVTEAKKYLK